MSVVRRWILALAVAVLSVAGAPSARALAAPAATSADSARVDGALARFERARARLSATEARARRLASGLDRAIRDQEAAQKRLHARARAMYRSGPTELLSVLLGAATMEDFTSRWDMLLLIGEHDAEEVRRLKALRAETARSAESLLAVQGEQARDADALEREVVSAKRALASSQAALARYRARTRTAAAAGGETHEDPMQRLHGSGAWKSAVASHYGLNFSGKGSSGERIGPYSMIVAHKTLPFGTLIEIQYKGRRAVARVADRGPNSPGRDFDLGPGVARVLHFAGVDTVRYRLIER